MSTKVPTRVTWWRTWSRTYSTRCEWAVRTRTRCPGVRGVCRWLGPPVCRDVVCAALCVSERVASWSLSLFFFLPFIDIIICQWIRSLYLTTNDLKSILHSLSSAVSFYIGLHPSLQVCNTAYLVPVPRHYKLGTVAAGRTSGIKLGVMMEVGASMVRMVCRLSGLSAHLPLLSPRLIKSRMMTDSHNTFQVWVGECLFWYRPTRVVSDKVP